MCEVRRAREEMVTVHLRLVVAVAKKYRGRSSLSLDLIHEGNIGLMHAIEKFNYRRRVSATIAAPTSPVAAGEPARRPVSPADGCCRSTRRLRVRVLRGREWRCGRGEPSQCPGHAGPATSR